LSERIFEIQG